MTTRLLALLVMLLAICAESGCSGSDSSPAAEQELAAGESVGVHVAPAPRAKEDGLPPPPDEVLAPRPSKPWSELIIGKWLYVGRDIQGQRIVEYTRDGKCITRYSYPAAPNHPKGIEVGTHEYRVDGTILYPPSTFSYDGGHSFAENTTFIEILTENDFVTLSIKRTRKSLEDAKQDARTFKTTVEQQLAEVREERTRSYYVRLKEK
jgi:hypothetical protein